VIAKTEIETIAQTPTVAEPAGNLGQTEVAERRDASGAEELDQNEAETTDTAADDHQATGAPGFRDRRWPRIVTFWVLPVSALLLAVGCGYLKWSGGEAHDAQIAGVQAMQSAKDSTTALLSYAPDTVDKQLGAAGDLLTGDFRNSYTQLIHDVVIPGAKEQRISTVATVPAAAVVSSTGNHVIVLVFVNQTAIVGQGAPTDTASTVRVKMDKIDGRWLISAFDPV
jgi:Mce-associated membrane protein